MKSENGITLIGLIITLIVFIIIASVSVYSGKEALNNTRLKGFYSQLEIVQKRVDDIAATNESYVDESGNIIYLAELGRTFEEMDSVQREALTNIIAQEGGDVLAGYIYNFRYFTSEELETLLNISNIDYNVFIDFENRIVIAEQGITIDRITYYMLESTTYFIKGEINSGARDVDFSVDLTRHGKSKYKLIVNPFSNIGGDLEGKRNYKI